MYYSKQTGGFYTPEIHGTNMPEDVVEISNELHASLLESQSSGGSIESNAEGFPEFVPAPPQTPEQITAQYINAVQRRLDYFAKTKGYDGILSACTYATSGIVKFRTEGQQCVNLRDATWGKCYQIMDEFASGQRDMPTESELMAELPLLSWTA